MMSSPAANLTPSTPATRRWTEHPLPTRRVRLFSSAPAPELAGVVGRFWLVRAEAPLDTPAVRRCAGKAGVDLVLTLDGHFCERAEQTLLRPGERHPYVIGPMSQPAPVVSSGRCTAVGVRIQPGRGSALLRTSLGGLRDRVVRLDALVPAALRGRAGAPVSDHPEVEVARLEQLLLALGARGGMSDPLVGRAVELIDGRRGALTVEELARSTGSTVRQLQRRFQDGVGLSPKAHGRIARVSHAMALLGPGARAGFADVVEACGFYDQAHLIREFRALVGTTPGAFLRERTRRCD
jgi:AraC-like DNA-binding protein